MKTIAFLPAIVLSAALVAWGQAGRGVEGPWQGFVEFAGTKLTIVVKVTKSPEGKLAGTMDSPDQGAYDIAIDEMTLVDDSFRFAIKRIGGVFEGKLNVAGSEIAGQWSQGGVSAPLVLKRIEKAPQPRRPQEPQKPYPYKEEEVVYENKKAGVKLAGTLTLPPGKGPFPVVLLISGSGAQDRNETIFGHRPFLVLADHLTRRGIAVLRLDDRGVGGSTGNVNQATSEDFAEDVLAGLEYLKTRREITPAQMGLVGHSEGGIIAPIAATRSKDVTFIVMMAGSALTGEEILYLQGALVARAAGAGEQAVARQRRIQEIIFAAAKQEKDNAAAEKRIRAGLEEELAKLSEEERKAMGGSQAMEAQLKRVLTPWFRFFLTYDPRPALSKVKCPVLAINGEKDLQVPPRENLPAIQEALKTGGNRDFTVKELPGLNHLFQTSKTGAISEYGRIEESIAPAALELISDWILARTGKR